MPWVKLDDGFPEHDKVFDLTDRAFRLHVTALCYCARNLTDGAITAKALRVITAIVNAPRPQRYVAELVTAGLWIVDGDGHKIRDYLEYNPSSERVKEDRAKARERMARTRGSGGSSGEQQGERSGGSSGVGSPSPTHPIPSRGLALALSPLQDAAQEKGKKPARERLLAACGGGQDAAKKLHRTINKWRSPEGDLEYAIECAVGPGVRDPLGVVLSELKKRGEARAA